MLLVVCRARRDCCQYHCENCGKHRLHPITHFTRSSIQLFVYSCDGELRLRRRVSDSYRVSLWRCGAREVGPQGERGQAAVTNIASGEVYAVQRWCEHRGEAARGSAQLVAFDRNENDSRRRGR